jgi:hypothetical protein
MRNQLLTADRIRITVDETSDGEGLRELVQDQLVRYLVHRARTKQVSDESEPFRDPGSWLRHGDILPRRRPGQAHGPTDT